MSRYLLLLSSFLYENQRKLFLSKNPGINKFWKLDPKLFNHESFPEHIQVFTRWKTLEMTFSKGKTLGR